MHHRPEDPFHTLSAVTSPLCVVVNVPAPGSEAQPSVLMGGRYWTRTSDPRLVRACVETAETVAALDSVVVSGPQVSTKCPHWCRFGQLVGVDVGVDRERDSGVFVSEEGLYLARRPAVDYEQPGGACVAQIVRVHIPHTSELHDPVPDPASPVVIPERGIHFGTVAPPNMGQRPTFDPESSILWDLGMLALALGAWRPTTVPKWIPLIPDWLAWRIDRLRLIRLLRPTISSNVLTTAT